MKIVFMGTPDFAVVSLKTLISNKHHVTAIVTVPDKPKSQHQKYFCTEKGKIVFYIFKKM